MASSVSSRNPRWIDGVTVSGQDMRRGAIQSVWERPGVIPGSAENGSEDVANRALGVLNLSTPRMQVLLIPGQAVVPSRSASGGFYVLTLDNVVTLDVAPSSANFGRKDLVVAEVVDTPGNLTTTSFQFRIVQGSASSAPAIPVNRNNSSSWVPLAVITVPANAESNGNITAERIDQSVRLFTAARGGTLLAYPQNRPVGRAGLTGFDIDTGRMNYHDGSTWKRLAPIDQGDIVYAMGGFQFASHSGVADYNRRQVCALRINGIPENAQLHIDFSVDVFMRETGKLRAEMWVYKAGSAYDDIVKVNPYSTDQYGMQSTSVRRTFRITDIINGSGDLQFEFFLTTQPSNLGPGSDTIVWESYKDGHLRIALYGNGRAGVGVSNDQTVVAPARFT